LLGLVTIFNRTIVIFFTAKARRRKEQCWLRAAFFISLRLRAFVVKEYEKGMGLRGFTPR